MRDIALSRVDIQSNFRAVVMLRVSSSIFVRVTFALFAFTAALTAMPVYASESTEPRFVSITIDNDFFAGYDQHYTNGFQVAFLIDRSDMPDFVRRLPLIRGSIDPQFTFAVGQRIYTPANTNVAKPDPNDRPYAGWLYVVADARTTAGSAVDHVLVSLGTVGPASLARQTQSAAHHAFSSRAAPGWDTQIRNAPTFMVGFERAWPGMSHLSFAGSEFDISPRVGGVIGNVFTYASIGAVFRLGHHLPNDLPSTHISLGPPRDGYRGASQFGWYLWTGFDGRAVGRNIFLDGSTFDGGAHVHRRPFGADVQAGVALSWPTARLGFSLVQRSREFDSQRGSDRFGQLSVSLAY